MFKWSNQASSCRSCRNQEFEFQFIHLNVELKSIITCISIPKVVFIVSLSLVFISNPPHSTKGYFNRNLHVYREYLVEELREKELLCLCLSVNYKRVLILFLLLQICFFFINSDLCYEPLSTLGHSYIPSSISGMKCSFLLFWSYYFWITIWPL